MDIEDLTKAQLILLVLLVSFVTSIATGIVTVSLLEEAPPTVTQTINRVVERTVERVVPETAQQGASVITKETTVVVKEEDLVTESIEKSTKSLVRIYRGENALPETFLGLGVVVDKAGFIATDASLVTNGEQYVVVDHSGKEFIAFVVAGSDLVEFLEIRGGEELSLSSAQLSDPSAIKLGQTAIALSGRDKTRVSMGIVSAINETENEEGVSVLSDITTTIGMTGMLGGSPVINIFGEVVGIKAEGVQFAPIPNLSSDSEPQAE